MQARSHYANKQHAIRRFFILKPTNKNKNKKVLQNKKSFLEQKYLA